MAPSGWYEVICGPRPPFVQWTVKPPQGPEEGRRGRWRNPSRRPAEVSHRARVSPDEAHEIACARVKQLQNAINALDEKDPFVASMRAELQKARSKARLVSVEDRIKPTTAFLEREEDIRDGEARRERLREEFAQDVSPPTVTGTSTNAELERLRGLVAELTQANSERRSARVAHPEGVPDSNAELVALRKERDTDVD